jgi:hypothetical protein
VREHAVTNNLMGHCVAIILRQYAKEKERSSSALCSYSHDVSVLENLRTKSTSAAAMKPKVRGTYQCGKCGMPKIRPHKCGDSAEDVKQEVTVKQENESPSTPLSMLLPTLSDEPAIAGEFSFRSRRNAHARGHSSDSSGMDLSRASIDQRLPLHHHTRSLDDAEFAKVTSAASPPRPPALSHPFAWSTDSPVRTVPAGPQQVISLVRKAPQNPLVFPSGVYEPPEAQTAAHSAVETDDSSTASSVRKRLLSPKSAAATSRSREAANKPRLAAVPVDDGTEPPHGAPRGSAVDSDECANVTPTSPQKGLADFTHVRESLDTAVPLYRSHSSTNLTQDANFSAAASDLSDEGSTASDERFPRFPACVSSSVIRPPSGFPTWNGAPLPAAVGKIQMMPFYSTVDQYGRHVMVPCWMPPASTTSTSASASVLAAASQLFTSTSTSAAEEAEVSPRGAKPARKPRARRTKASNSSDTAGQSNIVSPAKPANTRVRRRKVVTDTPTNTLTSLDAQQLDTLDEALSTLVSSELDADLDGTLDAFALELEGFGLGRSGQAGDEDGEEEDLFQYLSDDPLSGY